MDKGIRNMPLERGIWMLENQFHTAEDLLRFWKVFGPWI